MEAQIHLQTDRLLLREIVFNDVDNLFELDADPEVHRYLGNKPVTSKEQVIEVIANIRRQYEENGIARWALIDKHTGAFMGWSGLKYITETFNGHVNYYDIGYRLMKKYWGKGIATESAKAVLDYGFTYMNIPAVYATASVDNLGSNKVLQKIGLQSSGQCYYEDILCNWYALGRVEFIEHQLK